MESPQHPDAISTPNPSSNRLGIPQITSWRHGANFSARNDMTSFSHAAYLSNGEEQGELVEGLLEAGK